MKILLAILAGLLCGILSGFGIGGGTLLVLWLTLCAGLEQRAAQGVNLLFFLPTAASALVLHAKNRFISWKTTIPAALCGCVTAALGAWAAANMELGILRKLFGAFLIGIAILELRKNDSSTGSHETKQRKN